jgi:hypothetical protein
VIRTSTAAHVDADLAASVYDAECALHAARQSGAEAWVHAAADRLHLLLTEAGLVSAEPWPRRTPESR